MRNQRLMIRQGQTFALVHLVELVLAVLVVSILGLGIIGIINSNKFYQQYYSHDTAYMLETMHAIPNGNIEYGYLWSTPNFAVTVQPGNVIVSKVTTDITALALGNSVAKRFGQGRMIVEPTFIKPQFFAYSRRDGRDGGASPVTATPKVSLRPLSSSRECPPGAGYSGISAAESLAGDAVGKEAMTAVIQELQSMGATSTGISILIAYEYAPESQISVIDKKNSPLTQRVACVVQEQSANSGITITQTALSVESARLKNSQADIIFVMRGEPLYVSTLRQVIIDGLAQARGGSK